MHPAASTSSREEVSFLLSWLISPRVSFMPTPHERLEGVGYFHRDGMKADH